MVQLRLELEPSSGAFRLGLTFRPRPPVKARPSLPPEPVETTAEPCGGWEPVVIDGKKVA